jgi:hypothetical protein
MSCWQRCRCGGSAQWQDKADEAARAAAAAAVALGIVVLVAGAVAEQQRAGRGDCQCASQHMLETAATETQYQLLQRLAV